MSVPNEKNLDLSLLRFRKAPDEASGEALAEALLEASREKDALSIYETLRKLSPREPRFPFAAGKLLLAAGDYGAAQKALVDALRLAPGDRPITISLGEVLLKRGEPRRAVELLSKHRGEDDEVDRLLARAERFARLSEIGDEFAEASAAAQESKEEASAPDLFDAEGFLEEVPTEMIARDELELLRKPTETPKIDIEIEEDLLIDDAGDDADGDVGKTGGAPLEPSAPLASPAPPGSSAPAQAPLHEAIPLPEALSPAPASAQIESGETEAADEIENAEIVRGAPKAEHKAEQRKKRSLRFFVLAFLLAALAAGGAYLAHEFYEREQAREREELRQEISAMIVSAKPEAVREALGLVDRLGSMDELPAELRAEIAFGEAVALLDLEGTKSARLRELIPAIEAPLRVALTATADYADTKIAPKPEELPLPSNALDPRASYLIGRLKQIAALNGLADLEAAFRAERRAIGMARVEHALTLFLRGKKREAREILSEKPIDEAPRAAALASLLGLGEPYRAEVEPAAAFDQFIAELARIHAAHREGNGAAAREQLAAIPLPENGRGAIEALLLFRVAETVGALERAASALDLALELHPEDSGIRADAARLSARRGDLERSMALIEGLPPERTLALRAELAFRAPTEKALTELIDELDEADGDEGLLRALTLRRAVLRASEGKRTKTAEAETIEALEAGEEPLGLYALGLYQAAQGEYQRAATLLESARESFPNDALLLRELGRALNEQGQAHDAKEYLKEASELGDARALLWLIESLPEEARLAEGAALNEAALDSLRKDERARARTLIARSFIHRGEYEAAHRALDTLATDHLVDVLELRAELLYKEGRHEELIELVDTPLRQLIEGRQGARGELIPLLPLYGEALEATGAVRLAGPVFEAAVKLDPEATLGRLGYARSFIRAGKMWAALKVLERAEETLKAAGLYEAHKEEWLFLTGRALLALQRREEAEGPLLEASKLEGARAEIFFYLGEALAARKSAEARAAYERYLELEPNGAHRRRAERAIR